MGRRRIKKPGAPKDMLVRFETLDQFNEVCKAVEGLELVYMTIPQGLNLPIQQKLNEAIAEIKADRAELSNIHRSEVYRSNNK